jgi:Mannosyltransferase (PIG-V)
VLGFGAITPVAPGLLFPRALKCTSRQRPPKIAKPAQPVLNRFTAPTGSDSHKTVHVGLQPSATLARPLPIGSIRVSDAHLARDVFVVFVVSRAIVLLTAFFAALRLPVQFDSVGVWPGGPTGLWPAVLSRWDARWYFSVANDGYQYVPGQQSNVAFAPLFPALMRVGAAVTGRTDVDGMLGIGLLISNTALLVAVFFLARMVMQTWGASVAKRTVLCLLVFPTSFFLSAAYAESLFLACAVAALAAGEARHWWLAGILGGLAALARVEGVAIVLPLAWLYLLQHGFRLDRQVVWLGLIPTALLCWLAYLYTLSGDLLLPLHVHAAWGREAQLPWQAVGQFFSTPETPGKVGHFFIDSAFALAFGFLVVLTWRRLGQTHLALFATVFFLPIVSSGLVESAPRYMLENFPPFIVLGLLTHRRPVLIAYVVVALCASVVAIAHFTVGLFVA